MIDTSDAADAARFRWILDGHGYFMEESGLCGHGPCSEEEKNLARREIDKERDSWGDEINELARKHDLAFFHGRSGQFINFEKKISIEMPFCDKLAVLYPGCPSPITVMRSSVYYSLMKSKSIGERTYGGREVLVNDCPLFETKEDYETLLAGLRGLGLELPQSPASDREGYLPLPEGSVPGLTFGEGKGLL